MRGALAPVEDGMCGGKGVKGLFARGWPRSPSPALQAAGSTFREARRLPRGSQAQRLPELLVETEPAARRSRLRSTLTCGRPQAMWVEVRHRLRLADVCK